MHKIKMFFAMLFGLIALFRPREAFTVITSDFNSGAVSHDKAVTSGIFGQYIQVDYGDKMFVNRRLRSPIMNIDRLLPKGRAGTSTVRGFNKVIIKVILYSAAAFTTQSTAGAELEITLAAGDKNNVIENQIIDLDFEPANATTHTSEVIVSDKDTGNPLTIKVKATNELLKIGIAGTDEVPSGTLMNCLGTRFKQNSGSVDPVSHFGDKFENYIQEFKWPYEYSWIAGKENLYAPIQNKEHGIRKALDADAKEALLAFIEKSMLFQLKGLKKDGTSNSQDGVEWGQAQGMLYSIRTGGSPAVHTYSTWGMAKWEAWEWDYSDSDKDETFKSQIWCNRAFRKWLTDEKTTHAGWTWEKVPENVYGLPGMDYVETDAAKFELKVHPALNRRYPAMDKPMFVALTPAMMEIDYIIDFMLRANIQANEVTGYKSEYYAALTNRMYNLATPYWGICEPD